MASGSIYISNSQLMDGISYFFRRWSGAHTAAFRLYLELIQLKYVADEEMGFLVTVLITILYTLHPLNSGRCRGFEGD